MAFTRYYNKDISTWIETQAQSDLVDHVMSMDLPRLDKFKDQLNLTHDLNPAIESHPAFKIGCKLAILRYAEFKRNGVERDMSPPLTAASIAWACAEGIFLGGLAADFIGSEAFEFMTKPKKS
jgi:hypothetical protein